jgi:hypothetical protein
MISCRGRNSIYQTAGASAPLTPSTSSDHRTYVAPCHANRHIQPHCEQSYPFTAPPQLLKRDNHHSISSRHAIIAHIPPQCLSRPPKATSSTAPSRPRANPSMLHTATAPTRKSRKSTTSTRSRALTDPTATTLHSRCAQSSTRIRAHAPWHGSTRSASAVGGSAG